MAFETVPARPRAGRRLRIRFALSDAARVTLQVGRRGQGETEVAVVDAVAGTQTISWDGRLGGRRAKPGRYSVTLSAVRNGASGSSTLDVKLRR